MKPIFPVSSILRAGWEWFCWAGEVDVIGKKEKGERVRERVREGVNFGVFSSLRFKGPYLFCAYLKIWQFLCLGISLLAGIVNILRESSSKQETPRRKKQGTSTAHVLEF